MSEPHSLLTETRVRAPQLPSDPNSWLNTGGKAITLAQLRGNVVLLDFWTYGCVNCLHILPDLHYLEDRYAHHPFVLIGVHAGKFDNERNNANIASALQRLDIHHPVVCDNDHRAWDEYDVHAWPTLGIIDPDGYYLGSLSGEGHRDELDQVIQRLLAVYESAHASFHHLSFAQASPTSSKTALRFPGKVLADGLQSRLFIADTGNNRIVMCNLDGLQAQTVGGTEPGRDDGDWQYARFHHPQGLALVGDALYVCDCDNHLLRRVELAYHTVTTIAGTGAQGQARIPGGPGLSTPLSSPWDVCYPQGDEGILTLAMAGTHQLWRYDMRSGEARPYAGTGRESRLDGEPRVAAFAQPTGIAVEENTLYVVDSESSSLRRIRHFASRGEEVVETLVGSGLYAWGDSDGDCDLACLQHPQGVCAYRGLIYIADTYNHKIRVFDPVTNTLHTLAGTGQPGLANGYGETAQFYEPGGLSATQGKLYIADTNNHCIRVFDLETNIVSTLEVRLTSA